MIRRLFRTLRRPARQTASHMPGAEALFAELGRARSGIEYDHEDRRRDFQAVFLGSDAGKRVLYEVLAWSHVFASTFVPGDSHATHWREGGRDIGLRILAALNQEPPVSSTVRGPGSAGGFAEASAAVGDDSGRGARS